MSEAELETLALELQRSTAASRLTLGELRIVLARLLELGWAPSRQ